MPPLTDEVIFAPVAELARQIKAKQLSPVALTETYLQRLETTGRKLNAVVTILREQALADARVAEKEIQAGRYRGPLHGIPYGAKDLLATRNAPTTWGAAPFRLQQFDYDATVIRKLNAAGAILVAKLAMIELAGGFGYQQANASFTGPCKNPWNPNHWSGGSSSGSGAAVAGGLVPFAIGTETCGSIVCPSAYSGCTGLRPTFGRISRHGAMALCWSLDKIGPMARTADDCALIFSVLHGVDSQDGATVNRPFNYPGVTPANPKLRIGVIAGSYENCQPAVKQNFQESLKLLRTFCTVEDVELKLPDFPYGPAIEKIVASESASAFRELIESGRCKELTDAQDQLGGFASIMTSAVDYLHAQRGRQTLKAQMDKLVAPYDAVVAPTFPSVAVPIDKKFDEAFAEFDNGSLIAAGNLVGQPAVAVPNGFGPHGLPTSITFTGRIWTEAHLLMIAQRYQEASGWHRKHPVG